jgi:succinate dehydrogenase/fumarate reductase flavoprotein subunit
LGLLGLLTVVGGGAPGARASVAASNATTTKPTIKTSAIERTYARSNYSHR